MSNDEQQHTAGNKARVTRPDNGTREAAGTAPVQLAPEGKPSQGRARRLWWRARRFAKRILVLTTTLATTAVAGLIIWLVVDATLRRHTVDLGVIGVPKTLAENGFTSDVVTHRLREAITNVHDRATTKTAKTQFEVHQDMSGITIPKAEVSVEGMAIALHKLLPDDWRHEVSGEFTISGTQLSMQLRLNGRAFFSGTTAGLDKVDTLIEGGAFKLVQEVEPLVAAGFLFATKDYKGADAAVDYIIATLRHTDESAGQAYLLKGLIAHQLGEDLKAEAFYNMAPKLASTRALLVGNLRRDQHKPDDAITEYREAIRLDPKLTGPHNNLGNIWYDQKKLDDAIAEYREAIRLNPKLEEPHNNLGNVWHDQKKLDDAIAEYRVAIRLDPQSAPPHAGLGEVWHDQKKLDDAIAEYREAIRLDPKEEAWYYKLGLALSDLARSMGPWHFIALRGCRLAAGGAVRIHGICPYWPVRGTARFR